MAAQIALFDLGKVVVEWEPARLYERLIPDDDERAHFLSTVCTWDWHCKHDQGSTMAQNASALIARFPDKEHLIRAWSSHWLDMFVGYVVGVPQLIYRLQARGVPLFALTNFPGDKWSETRNAYGVLQVFEDVIVSGHHKITKPNREIYEIALERMGWPNANDVFFVDDRLENVEAARAIGMQAHQFKTADDLEVAMKSAGLLV